MDNDFIFYCPFCDHGIVRGMNGREDRAKPNERAVRHVARHFRGVQSAEKRLAKCNSN